MNIRGFEVAPFNSLPADDIQAFLQGLAVLSLRHGVVVDMANLMPRYAGVGGYFLSSDGYLTIASPDEVDEMAHAIQEAASPESRAYMAPFGSMTSHDRIRILRGLT